MMSWMKRRTLMFAMAAVVAGMAVNTIGALNLSYDEDNAQLAFAAQEITAACAEVNNTTLEVSLLISSDPDSPEKYVIDKKPDGSIVVTGSDNNGAMYGGFEVAEYIKLGLPLTDVTRTPFVPRRGLKLNMPMDARSPSYCDQGDAAQRNIENIWDFENFWKPYLDDMARYRYNILSIWTSHPYPNMVKVPGYDDCQLEDVYRVKEEILEPGLKVHEDMDTNLDGIVDMSDGTIEFVRSMTIDEKIDHWHKVFQYAGERGLEVYLFHWDVYVNNANTKYGITENQRNQATIDYVHKSVEQALAEYPELKGIGVTSGENERRELDGTADSCENFIYKTYAQAIIDSGRKDVRFIFRRHSSQTDWVAGVTDPDPDYGDAVDGPFANYPDDLILESSTKYSVAHMYSTRRPQEWERRVSAPYDPDDKTKDHEPGDDWLARGYKIWLNLRNDDIFMHRWGSPDFVREFIKNMPHGDIPGFYMGSDGYFWGREHISKNPANAGEMEIAKHWYNFRMWGEMAYNNQLDDAYWQAVLKHRFGLNDTLNTQLFEAWQTVSEVIPQLNRSTWAATDGDFAPELCQGDSFLTANNYYFERPPMTLRNPPPAGEQPCVSCLEWATNYYANASWNPANKLTPLEVADNLDGYADAVDAVLPTLKAQAVVNSELWEVLTDMESMAMLGRYYADKQRSAAQVMLYRVSGRMDQSIIADAVDFIKQAQQHWNDYAAILDTHYMYQVHAKTGDFNWNQQKNNIRAEVEQVIAEKFFPQIEFSNLVDGDSNSTGDLTVDFKIYAANGLVTDGIKLFVNGDPKTVTGTYPNYSCSLTGLAKDWIHLEVAVRDKSDFLARRAIYVNVRGATTVREDWRDETYAVLMSANDVLKAQKDDTYEEVFPGYGKFQFDDSGKIKFRNELMNCNTFQSYSKSDNDENNRKHYAEFYSNGYVDTHPNWPGDTDTPVIWSSRGWKNGAYQRPAPVNNGFSKPFEFILTRDKRLAIVSTATTPPSVAWSEKQDFENCPYLFQFYTGKGSVNDLGPRPGFVDLFSNEESTTVTKTWTISDLNSTTGHTVVDANATINGMFSGAGKLGASDSFSITASAVKDWDTASAQAAANSFNSYLSGLSAAEVKGSNGGQLGVDSGAGDNSVSGLGPNINEALVYTVNAANLPSGQVVLKKLTLNKCSNSDRIDFAIYDASADQLVYSVWNGNFNDDSAVMGYWELDHGDKFIIGNGDQDPVDQDFKVVLMYLDVTESGPPIIRPTASFTSASVIDHPINTPHTFTATAADADGSVTKVEMFMNGGSTAIASENGPGPYSLTTPSLSGYDTSYTFTVKATDNDGNISTVTTASTRTVKIEPEIVVPVALIQHLDASVIASVPNSPVTLWADQTANGYDAVNSVGDVTYSTLFTPANKPGLDFGAGRTSLELFNATESDVWLDNSSFCVLVAFKCDELNTNTWSDVIGNSTAVADGFGMRYRKDGISQAYLDGAINLPAAVVSNDTTVVMGMNYDAATGEYEFWSSAGDTSVTGTKAAADFSTAAGVTLGSTTDEVRFMKGLVGEVKVYSGALSTAEFDTERDALVSKWTMPGTDELPVVVSITASDIQEGEELMVSAVASDDIGVINCTLEVSSDGGANYSLVGSDSVHPYEWSISSLTEGGYTLKVTAEDSIGQSAFDTTMVSVTNDVDLPPVVTFITPTNGSEVVEGTLLVTVDATDDVGVNRVSLRIEGVVINTNVTIGVDNTAPYQWDGSTGENDPNGWLANLQPGIYTIRAIAFDAADASANKTNKPITITVVGGNSPYKVWADQYGGTGVLGAYTNDYDKDGIPNLVEYALGGIPNSKAHTGTSPKLINKNGNLFFVHPRRSGDTDLTYSVKTSTNLVSGGWDTANFTTSGTNEISGTMTEVTNIVDKTEYGLYLRLEVDRK